MMIRLNSRYRSMIRTGMATVTLSALLLTTAGAPAFAATSETDESTATVSQSQNSNAAQNVNVSASGTTITVTWTRPDTFRGDYSIKLLQGGRTLTAVNSANGPAVFQAPTVQVNQTYTVSLTPFKSNGWEEDTEATVTSAPITVEDTAPARTDDSATNGSVHNGSADPGSSDPAGSSQPVDGGTSAPSGDAAPTAPSNVRLSKRETTSLLAEWNLATSDTRITGYRVTLYKVLEGSEQTVTFFDVGPAVLFKQFDNLKDGTYRVSVASEIASQDPYATPARSAAVSSPTVVISTAPEVTPDDSALAPSAPYKANLRLTAGNSNSLDASWFPPETKNGKITAYDVQLIGSDNSTEILSADMSVELPEYMTITSVKPGVTYTIKVRAQNSHGWSDWSEASNAVEIPADPDAFAMRMPDEVFAHVDEETARVVVEWINSGFEPKHGRWLVSVRCLSGCPENYKNIREDAPTNLSGVMFTTLKPGVYQAALKLVDGPRISESVMSNVFVVGHPTVNPDPKLIVTPTRGIDPNISNTFHVNGIGYVGFMASKGVYVVAADPSVWAPGQVPTPGAENRFAHSIYIPPTEINSGSFSVNFTVPAGAFDSTKKYVIGTMAAHQLAIAEERTMDAGVPISFIGASDNANESGTTDTPGEQPGTQPDTAPGTTPSEQPGNGGTTNEDPAPGTQPGTQPGTTPSDVENPAQDISVVATVDAASASSFTVGKEATVDFVFTGAPEGSRWTVSLHSDPVLLGLITVKNARAQLTVPAATAAQFVPGNHHLVLTLVSDDSLRTLSLPWKVVPAQVTPPTNGNTGTTSTTTTELPKNSGTVWTESNTGSSNAATSGSSSTAASSSTPKATSTPQGAAQASKQNNAPDLADHASAAPMPQSSAPGKSNSVSARTLARTGSDAATLGMIGLALLLSGSYAYCARRRNA